jgi:hypothetical protein
MKRLLAGLGLALGLVSGAGALAQDARPTGPVVVELFTSQGCSACPPADMMMADLAARDDVIALSLHVDYWNYLGWEDTFSQAVFTERQYGYGRAAGSTVVYTPQIIVGGQDRVMGARAMELADRIAAHRAAARPGGAGGVAGRRRGHRDPARWVDGCPRPRWWCNWWPIRPMKRSTSRAARTRAGWRSITTSCATGSWSDWNGAEPFVPKSSARPTCRMW